MHLLADAPTRNRRGELGQFFTAPPVANFMASMFGPLPTAVRLLDAGAGEGALTSAFLAELCENNRDVEAVEATLYEVDPLVLEALSMAMRECQLRCKKSGVAFTFTICQVDFIEEASAQVAGDLFSLPPPAFDAAIVNPPYRKIGSDSVSRHALRTIGVETSNLYTGFIALIQRLLVPGGQLVGITPRSFCNGPYFRPFREEFLAALALHRIHLFDSRQAAFRGDGVLQENIIFHAVKGQPQPSSVIISSSSGEPGGSVEEAAFPFQEIVHPGDTQQFIHIPSADAHRSAKVILDGLSAHLADFGVTVSTGRVVDFRLKQALRPEPEMGAVPLLYPCHFNGGTVHWPKVGARKPNAILDNDETRPWLVPSGIYLLTKRFTSKEERRRIVACLFDPDQVAAEWLGFENHLNYFHANGRGLERNLALGLYAFLNSTFVDQYFRRFSGHTQVNATDLRALAYPDRQTLTDIGKEMKILDFSQDEIDELVTKHIHACR